MGSSALTMRVLLVSLLACLATLATLAPLATAGPAPPLLWDLEDWADDLHYDLTHPDSGGPLGFGILGTTTPRTGLIQGVIDLLFPTTTTTPTTEAPTTKCGGLLGLGLAC